MFSEEYGSQQKERHLIAFTKGAMFSIKVFLKDSEKTVSHLPREILRITKFILDRNATVNVKLSSSHYRRSPLRFGRPNFYFFNSYFSRFWPLTVMYFAYIRVYVPLLPSPPPKHTRNLGIASSSCV